LAVAVREVLPVELMLVRLAVTTRSGVAMAEAAEAVILPAGLLAELVGQEGFQRLAAEVVEVAPLEGLEGLAS